MKKARTMEIGDQVLENQQEVQRRLCISDYTLRALQKRDFPKRVKIGQNTFYDREAVDNYFLSKIA
jgi:hypothetical protein